MSHALDCFGCECFCIAWVHCKVGPAPANVGTTRSVMVGRRQRVSYKMSPLPELDAT